MFSLFGSKTIAPVAEGIATFPTYGRFDDDMFVRGTSDDDYITTFGGDDTITSGDGNDVIETGGGRNKVYTGDGDDIVTLGGDKNFVHTGNGDDHVLGSSGRDKVLGGNGDDRLAGLDGDDELHGENGDDLIVGGAGNDVVAGGTGNDMLWGGDDADEFVFTCNDDRDVIRDFEVGVDTLTLVSGGQDCDLSVQNSEWQDGAYGEIVDALQINWGDTVILLEDVYVNEFDFSALNIV